MKKKEENNRINSVSQMYQSVKKQSRQTIKVLLIVLMTVLLLPTATGAQSKWFDDVPRNHEAASAIQNLVSKSIISGYEDGTFRPGNDVTRAEISKMVSLIRDLPLNNAQTPFRDVKRDAWYNPYVNALYATGSINGYDGNLFKPQASISRAEVSKLLVEAYDIPSSNKALPFTDVSNRDWSAPYIKTLYAHGLISGKTNRIFSPSEPIKRIDLAGLLVNVDRKFGGKNKAPGNTVTPGDKPSQTEKPDKPSSTNKPGSSDKPSNTEKPGSTNKPSDTVIPGYTERPNHSGTPGSKYTAVEILDHRKFNDAFRKYVNAERATIGGQALRYGPSLKRGADIRVDEMIGVNNISHTRPNRTSYETAFNYISGEYRLLGENIAFASVAYLITPNDRKMIESGKRTLEDLLAEEFFILYRNSPSHYKNLMNKKYEQMTVSSKYSPESGRIFNAMILMRPR